MRASSSHAWTLLALLLLPLALTPAPAAAAPDPNARDPLVTGAQVTSLAVARAPAGTGGALTAGTLDPGAAEPGGRVLAPDEDAWFLWAGDGRILFNTPADRVGCNTTLPEDDCLSDVASVGISRTGTRLAAVSKIDPQTLPPGNPNLGLLTFATSDNGVVARAELKHEPVHVAVAADGSRVAVLMRKATTPATSVGSIVVYDFPASTAAGTPVMEADLDAAATRLALAPDGRNVAAVGAKLWIFATIAANVTPFIVPQQANAVVTGGPGGTSPYWTVVGFENDDVRVYRTTSSGSADAGSFTDAGDAVGAVALSDDFKVYVAGDDAGRLHIHSLDAAAANRPGRFVAQADVSDAAIDDVALTADGRYIAVRTGAKVQFHHWDGRALAPLWEHTLPAAASGFGMSASGDLIAASHGTGVTVFDALHDIDVTVPARSAIQANETRTFDLSYRNDGNRIEDVALAARAPTGWGVAIEPANLTLRPDQTLSARLTVTAPRFAPPELYRVNVTRTLSDGSTATDAVELEVPLRRAMLLSGDARSLAVEPGATVSFQVRLRNAGNAPAEATLRAEGVPAGWDVAFVPDRATLAPDAARDVEVAVQAPADAAEGASARFTVLLVEDPAQRLRLTATVGGYFQHELRGPPGIIAPVANDTRATLTVRNTGNAPDTYDVQVGAFPQGWLVSFEGGQILQTVADVEPGGVREMTILVRPGPGAEPDSRFTLSFKSQSRAQEDRQSTHTLIATVGEPGDDGCPKGQKRNDEGACEKESPGASALVAVLVAAALVAVLRRRF